MQKENIDKVEYGFLLTDRKLELSPICNCPSLLSTIPAVTWLGQLCWTEEFGLRFNPPPSSNQVTPTSTNSLISSF